MEALHIKMLANIKLTGLRPVRLTIVIMGCARVGSNPADSLLFYYWSPPHRPPCLGRSFYSSDFSRAFPGDGFSQSAVADTHWRSTARMSP